MKKKQNLNKKMGDTELCFKCDRAPCDRSMLRMAPASKKKSRNLYFVHSLLQFRGKERNAIKELHFTRPKIGGKILLLILRHGHIPRLCKL